MEIRLADVGDAEAIRGIYNHEVLRSTVTFDLRPRSLEEQTAWLEARSGAHVVIVAVDGDEVVGLRLALALPRSSGVLHQRRGLGLRPRETSAAPASDGSCSTSS